MPSRMKLIVRYLFLSTALSMVFLGISSCDKIELPDPDQENPVFGLNFQMGNDHLNLGGLNTKVLSDVYWDELGIRVFENTFVNEDDNTALIFRLRDNRPSEPMVEDDTAYLFNSGRFEYMNQLNRNSSATYLMNRSRHPDYVPYIQWRDATVLDTAKGRPFHLVSGFDANAEYIVCQTIKSSANTCETAYCKWWKYSDGEIPLLGFATKANGIWPVFPADYSKPLSFIWNEVESEALKVIDQSGKYEVRIFTGNTIAEVEMYIGLDEEGNVIPPCFDPFSSEMITFEQQPAFSQVELIWIDAQGTNYSSSIKAQSESSFFTIQEVNAINLRNQEGHRVQKVDVTFECTLYSDSGESITIKGAKGAMGLPYY